ncbi:two-component system response regulator DegU [Caldalkalibacillus uzonensis]|uniref:Two-component system response regulator DegU n=1 Tax=Caldalkalibacillus uzonensis TaxID=353224 RepID=A0ABU0CTZ0_9BACI|nr:response regulator transcription factor [Caldalkalibacillus uzonensis]MDQ0339891.1 two-component system response regulator DegU [Caldalkalibacillus uzonensis]
MSSENKIRILIIDDHTMFREGVKRVIDMEEDFEVVGQAGDGEAAVQLVQELEPDVILMDINLPGMNGVEATEAVLRYSPDSKIIILSIHDDESYVFRTLQSGAKGYLLKEMDIEALSEAIRAVHEGGAYIHPKVTGKLVEEFRRLKQQDTAERTGEEPLIRVTDPSELRDEYEIYQLLTKREFEVLQLMAQGKSNKAIGEALFISEKTVKNHVSSILQKMKVQDRTQAVIEAIKNGWVNIER